jgi:uncharacterized protein (DUF1499 family)
MKLGITGKSDTTIIGEQPGCLRGKLRTMLFVEAVKFLLDREKRVIEVCSASCSGYSVLGKNYSRMEEIRSQFLATEVKP